MFGNVLKIILWIFSALALACYIAMVAHGLRDPHPRDAVEAAVLEQAARIAQGEMPFSSPAESPGVALMPGPPLVVAGLIALFDSHTWEPRVVALLFMLLTAAGAAMVVYWETANPTLGITGAAFMLLAQGLGAGTPIGGCPQAMLLLLVLLGCLSLRYTQGMWGALLAVLPFTAACFTHPAGLWFAFAAIFHLMVQDRRRCAVYTAALAALVGGGQIWMTMKLGTGFNFHAWEIPAGLFRFQPLDLLLFVGAQLLGTLGVLTLATVLTFALPTRPWLGAAGVWTWMALGAMAAGMLATQTLSPATDALPIAAVAIAIVGSVSIQRLINHVAAWPGSTRTAGSGVVLTAVALQFIMLLARAAPALQGTS